MTTLTGVPGTQGSADGTGHLARFWNPYGVAVGIAGCVYVADSVNATIRKVAPGGEVTTLAGLARTPGSADGTGSTARFSYPKGVAVDNAGNVYVADTSNHTIRKVSTTGVVTTLAGLAGNSGSADGAGSAARFKGPTGVAVDSAGNLYVADFSNNTIRMAYPALMILNSGPDFGFNSGQFGFLLTGPTGQLVIVETSTNLVNWSPIWTNTLTGVRYFSDTQSSANPKRFYRTRTP